MLFFFFFFHLLSHKIFQIPGGLTRSPEAPRKSKIHSLSYLKHCPLTGWYEFVCLRQTPSPGRVRRQSETSPASKACPDYLLFNFLHEALVVVQSLSRVRLFATPWTAARQASLSITNSRSSLRLMSIESVIQPSHPLSSPSPPSPNPYLNT